MLGVTDKILLKNLKQRSRKLSERSFPNDQLQDNQHNELAQVQDRGTE